MTEFYKLLNGVTPANGGTGDWHKPQGKRPGKWMPAMSPVVPCKRGYHVVTQDHLLAWSGTDLWRVEVRGELIDHGDKWVAEQARLISRVEGWTPTNLRLFAAVCAAEVLHLFESERPGDDRPRKAIEVAAARGAAWTAAAGNAWDAAWDAARDAVVDAARDAAAAAARAAAQVAARAVAGDAAGAAARYAARDAAWDAAWALAVRDLIGQDGFTQQHYDLLTKLWRTVIGPVHPDDAA